MVIVAASLLVNVGPAPVGHTLDAAVLEPIEVAVKSASRQGHVVLPGGEGGLSDAPVAYRSGFVPLDADLESSLEQLSALYRTNPSVDIATWLIAGYLATGQFDNARDYLRDARQKLPDTPEIITLAGLLAYFESNLDESEALLRFAVSQDPDNAVALVNLAVVLKDRGDEDGSAQIIEDIEARFSDSAIAERAAAVIQ